MFIHTEIINWAIQKKGYSSYLEIGINNPVHNFDLIQCKFKIGVDPDPNAKANFCGTSDEFFGQIIQHKFDCIFIDGLHHADQVKKDFENSLACLNDGGAILIHDTDPKDEKYTHVPRDVKGRWNGDVYKFMMDGFDKEKVQFRTPDIDANGLTVFKRGVSIPLRFVNNEFDTFIKCRRDVLNLCTRKEFEEWI